MEHRDTDEAAWEVAVEAAPWLVGTAEPDQPIPAKELFERLKPFQEEVARRHPPRRRGVTSRDTPGAWHRPWLDG